MRTPQVPCPNCKHRMPGKYILYNDLYRFHCHHCGNAWWEELEEPEDSGSGNPIPESWR